MQDKHYYLVLLTSSDPKVQKSLCQRLKLSDALAEKLFAKPYNTIKRQLDYSRALQLQEVIESAGADCRVVEEGQPFALNSDPEQKPADAATNLTPDDLTKVNQPSVDKADALPANKVFCIACGKIIDKSAAVCPVCKTAQHGEVAKSKLTATLLALFLGGFGAHRFYLNQWWCIFYVIFSPTLIPSLVGIIEGIIFLLMPPKHWQKNYQRVPKGAPVLLYVAAFGVAIIPAAIVSAISIPAYHDYTARAKIAESLPTINDTRDQLTTFIERVGFLPNQNIDASLPKEITGPYIESIVVSENAVMTVIFTDLSGHSGSTLIYTPTLSDNKVSWDCTQGTLAVRHRPEECRSSEADDALAEEDTETIIEQAVSQQTLSDADNSMRIQVPDSWEKRTDLNQSADLQVANLNQDVYFIALGENKKDFAAGTTLEDYRDIVTAPFFNSLKNIDIVSGPTPVVINQQPAFIYEITGTVENLRAHYFVVCAQSNGRFFQLLAWSTHSRFDRNRDRFEEIIYSFSAQ